MDKTLIILDPTEYGIEKKEAEQIQSVFVPMLEKMTELENQYNEIIKQSPSKEVCAQARSLRLELVSVRSSTKEIHKKAKAYYLAGGRLVDAWKNAQEFAALEKEETLEKIEKHFELIEAAKLEKIRQERVAALSEFVSDVSCYDLKSMTENGFAQLLENSKLAFQARKDAEAKAEADRIEQQKKDAEEREQMRIENEKLKKEAEARELEQEKERKKQNKILAEAQAKAKKEAEARAKLEAEKVEQQRKADELKAREIEAKEQAEMAPDKEKLLAYANELGRVIIPRLTTAKAQKTLGKALTLLSEAVVILGAKK